MIISYELPAGSRVLDVAEAQYQWVVAIWETPDLNLVAEVTYAREISTVAYWKMAAQVNALSSKYGLTNGRVHPTYHNGPDVLGLPEEQEVISFWFALERDRSTTTGEIPRVLVGN